MTVLDIETLDSLLPYFEDSHWYCLQHYNIQVNGCRDHVVIRFTKTMQ